MNIPYGFSCSVSAAAAQFNVGISLKACVFDLVNFSPRVGRGVGYCKNKQHWSTLQHTLHCFGRKSQFLRLVYFSGLKMSKFSTERLLILTRFTVKIPVDIKYSQLTYTVNAQYALLKIVFHVFSLIMKKVMKDKIIEPLLPAISERIFVQVSAKISRCLYLLWCFCLCYYRLK